MKDFIRKTVRESLLLELGTSQPAPFKMRYSGHKDRDPHWDIMRPATVLYSFQIGQETIACTFQLKDIRQCDNKALYSYSFEFKNAEQSPYTNYEMSNDFRTLLVKMTTITAIMRDFVKFYKKTYEKPQEGKRFIPTLAAIEMYGVPKDIGAADGETQRSKLYHNYLSKFQLPEFTYTKQGNEMKLTRQNVCEPHNYE